MTPEFGAASQLEKIDMLDFADVVAINKFERRGAEDARRDVARQLVRNREAFGIPWEEMPVFGTSAARFNDDGVTALYQHLRGLLAEQGLPVGGGRAAAGRRPGVHRAAPASCPAARARYLAEIAETVRGYHRTTEEQAGGRPPARQHLRTAAELLGRGRRRPDASGSCSRPPTGELLPEVRELLEQWPARVEEYSGDELVYRVRDKEIRTPLTRETLSGTKVRRVALPRTQDDGELLRFLRRENLPGAFPFTAGVFPFKREGEAPARMFAGEGDAFRTNRRFQLLSRRAATRPGCRPRSTRSRSTAATPTCGRTSTARSAPPGSRSRRSTTWRCSTPASTCARRRRRCR